MASLLISDFTKYNKMKQQNKYNLISFVILSMTLVGAIYLLGLTFGALHNVSKSNHDNNMAELD